MRIKDAWQTAGIERTDAEVLIAGILKRDRSWILAHEDSEIAPDQFLHLSEALVRRSKGEPVAYILGKRDFYGRTFIVDSSVLIPRPATEGLIDLALEMTDGLIDGTVLRSIDTEIVAFGDYWGKKDESLSVIDIGTGSGCIAVTLACERPDIGIIATDISAAALSVARKNAAQHDADGRIQFRQGSLLEPVAQERKPFIIISNPPYVPDDFLGSSDLSFEPSQAIFAGSAGLDVLLPVVEQARGHPACRGFLVECREDQTARLR